MTINVSTVKRVKYTPELLPNSTFITILAGREASPPAMDLRMFRPELLSLAYFDLSRDADIEVRIKADDYTSRINAGGLLDNLPTTNMYTAKNDLFFNTANIGLTTKSNFPVRFGVWVETLNVALKIKHGLGLTGEEEELNKKRNIYALVEKGLLPLPLKYQLLREYQIVRETTYTVNADLIAHITHNLTSMPSIDTNQFFVLTNISAVSGTASDAIEVTIGRDGDSTYTVFSTLGLSLDRSLDCFIPAIDELQINAQSQTNVSGFRIRFKVLTCKLTNVLRIKWGLVTKDEVSADLWEKVQSGIL